MKQADARVTVFSVLLAALVRPAEGSASCLVRGSRAVIQDVIVQPLNASAFRLNVFEVPVAAEIPQGWSAPVKLKVTGALAFNAVRKNVWMTVVGDHSSDDGVVQMHRGARITHAHLQREQVIATAALYANDVLEGEDKAPDVMVFPVTVPCSLLTLDFMEMDDAESVASESGETLWWQPKSYRSAVQLFAKPTVASKSVQLTSPFCVDCLEMKEVGVSASWLQVETTGEGVTVRGWVRRSALQRKASAGGQGQGCAGDHNRGLGGVHRARRPAYDGPAEVRAGTQVFSNPPLGRWAVVTTDIEVNVHYVHGEGWVELREIPGIESSPEGLIALHAHVPLESVSFPSPNVR